MAKRGLFSRVGTSLSIGWGLIKRFSEDVDFKVAMPAAASRSKGEAQCKAYRRKVLDALGVAGFELIEDPLVRNENKYFAADLAYNSEFGPAPGLRTHLKIEMSFQTPALPAIERPIRSLVAQAQGKEPEIAAFACIDPVETAADKLSALAWRVCVRARAARMGMTQRSSGICTISRRSSLAQQRRPLSPRSWRKPRRPIGDVVADKHLRRPLPASRLCSGN